MVFRVRSVIFLATLCIVNQRTRSDSVDGSSDEERSLKDALLLIRLIRTGTVPDTASVAELLSSFPSISMRPPSLPKPPLNVSSFNNTFQPVQNALRRKIQPREVTDERKTKKRWEAMAKLKAEPTTRTKSRAVANTRRRDNTKRRTDTRRQDTRRRGNINSRRGFYRRQDYDDPFGAHPNETTTEAPASSSTVSTLSATPSSIATSVGVSTENMNKETSTVAPALQDKQVEETTASTVTASNQIQRQTSSRIQKLSLVNRNTTQNPGNGTAEPQAKDPIISQVQNELENELKGVASSDKHGDILLKFQQHNAIGNISVRNPTTLRIHLKSSSRYPLPLPENHALCYHHPDNGLCRTPI